jgi:UDP-hydrolysing UDP-N-acetyl-D-glucosamine 2-epimerase
LNSARTIAVLTTGRQDYGILRSTLLLLRDHPAFRLLLWVGGMHLQERFGRSADLIRRDGFDIARELPFVGEPPDPSRDASCALEQVATALAEDRCDALLLVGDRAETLAAAFAATIAALPIIHVHGGEESEGAIDNAMRHAITKLSHLHLVSHEVHARRVRQMGEDPLTVVVVGAPGLDNLYRTDLPTRCVLERELGCALTPPVVVVTLHPTTLGGDPRSEVEAVAGAMEAVPAAYIVTQANADAGGTVIRDFWRQWVTGRRNVVLADGLGEARYWGLLGLASAVLGNSSSGLAEAPAAGVPAINVGDRQLGRLRGTGVCDVPAEPEPIAAALRRAITLSQTRQTAGIHAPYPSGPAAPRIVEAIAAWHPPSPPRKRFHAVA